MKQRKTNNETKKDKNKQRNKQCNKERQNYETKTARDSNTRFGWKNIEDLEKEHTRP